MLCIHAYRALIGASCNSIVCPNSRLQAVHATGGGVTRPRHQAGTAFRITLGDVAHDPAVYGPFRPTDAELLELVSAVVAQCGPYVQQQQYGLGLALYPDSVYFVRQLRHRLIL